MNAFDAKKIEAQETFDNSNWILFSCRTTIFVLALYFVNKTLKFNIVTDLYY